MSAQPGTQRHSGSLSHLAKKPWESISEVCKDAAVFLDDGAAELLHWAGGIELLSNCVGVYDLNSQLSAPTRSFIAAAPYCHVVIVVCSFLHGSISERISSLLSDLQPLECHVMCSQSEEMHAQLIPMSEGEGLDYGLEGYSHFGEFQGLMRKWINREAGVRVSVQHFPLFHAEVCQGLLTTPPHSTLFPLLPSDIVDIQARLLSEGQTDCSLDNLNQVDFTMLTRQFQISIKSFASSLNYFLEEWDIGEDIFSLGPTSRFIGNQLATLPAAKVRRKTASQRCSLLLIDRSLDMTGPTLHSAESLADRILSLLPHVSPLGNDVAIDMSPLSSATSSKDNREWALNGSLAQPLHPKAKHLLKTLISSKQKESMMEVSRCLLDSLSQEGLSIKLSGKMARPSALQLRTFIEQFKDHQEACVSQHEVLQLACAVLQALDGDIHKQWDKLSSMEKVLLLSLHDKDSPSVCLQLTEQARQQTAVASNSSPHKEAPSLSLAELLGVAVGVFSLVGEKGCLRSGLEETRLKEALADLAMQWRSCDINFLGALGIAKADSRSRVIGRFGTVLQRLEGLGDTRAQLSNYQHTFSPEDPSLLPYRPLLSQVTEAIFDSGRPEMPDLNYHSQASVANILKSGFSLFVSSARPRPNQHPVLLLFVMGGVSCSEVHQIKEVVSASKTNVEVVIGTTRLATSQDLIKQVLCTTNN